MTLEAPPLEKKIIPPKRIPAISLDVPNTIAEELGNGMNTFDLADMKPLERIQNTDIGISQDLMGILSIDGKPSFALSRVEVDTGEGTEEALAVSKILGENIPDERPPLQGLVTPESSVSVGGGSESGKPRNITLSLLDDKSLVIEATGWSQLDLVVAAGESEKGQLDIAPRGLSRFMRASRVGSRNLQLGGLLGDFKRWAVASRVIQDAVLGSNWDYTAGPEEIKKLGQELKFYEEPYVDENNIKQPARYRGREVIARDTPINGGVYIVPGVQEAIVVDDYSEKPEHPNRVGASPYYAKAYRKLLEKSSARGVRVEHGVKYGTEFEILRAALETATELMEYDSEAAKNVKQQFTDKKLNLSYLIDEGKGVCRHQALLVAYLLEKVIKDGRIEGKVSVDRNYIKGRGGHAWARYTDRNGGVYVIDPAQGFVGTLEESRTKAKWNYFRPEDTTTN